VSPPITINETNNTITVTQAAANTVVVQQPAATTLTISASGPQGPAGDLVYELTMFLSGVIGSNERIFKHAARRSFTFPAGMATSGLHATTAATASTVFSLRKNGSEFATITVAPAGTSGTLASASGASFVSGDVLEVFGPAPADLTLADVSISLIGTKV
jgi:hypothetical protein